MENIDISKRILMTDKLFEKLGFKQRKNYCGGLEGYKYEKTIKIGQGRKGIEERISVKREGNNQYLIRHEFLGPNSIEGVKTLCDKFGCGSAGCHKTICYFDELCDYLYSRQSFIVKSEDFLID